jgi:hypothetical protein
MGDPSRPGADGTGSPDKPVPTTEHYATARRRRIKQNPTASGKGMPVNIVTKLTGSGTV